VRIVTVKDLGSVECEDVCWIQLAQDRVRWLAALNTTMSLLDQQSNRVSRKNVELRIGLLHGNH
jgi:hypothetical protein